MHPLDGRKIPIITDAELVDMSFGTGAVKITPAHDPNDFATGKRHNLQFMNILTNEGNINASGGQFAGQPRFKVCMDLSLARHTLNHRNPVCATASANNHCTQCIAVRFVQCMKHLHQNKAGVACNPAG